MKFWNNEKRFKMIELIIDNMDTFVDTLNLKIFI
jgi:hypothetical protein